MLPKFCLLALLVLLASGAGNPRTAPAEALDTVAIDTWLDSWADAGFLSGCVLVARGDEVLYERCFADANAELGVPNAPTTRFAIASITKSMQLVLLARMVDAGLLTLEDKVSQWIEGFPSGDRITVLQLATHEAAIPHRVTDASDEIFARTAADMVERVKEAGLMGEPGGESVYSSAGYSVLARVLELAGGESWEELMQREVFGVAGMTQTTHPSERRLIPERASGYRWTPEGYRLTDPKDLSFLVGAGSLFSTPRDLLRFTRTVVTGGFGETAQEYVLTEGSLRSNGLTNGQRAYADFDAATDLSVIVCANVVTGALAVLRESLPEIFAGGEIPTLELPRIDAMVAAASEVHLERYEGNYELRPGRNLGVRGAGTHLDVDGWMLLPLGPDSFFCVQDFGKVVFQYDDAGAITGMLWGKSEHSMPRVGDLE